MSVYASAVAVGGGYGIALWRGRAVAARKAVCNCAASACWRWRYERRQRRCDSEAAAALCMSVVMVVVAVVASRLSMKLADTIRRCNGIACWLLHGKRRGYWRHRYCCVSTAVANSGRRRWRAAMAAAAYWRYGVVAATAALRRLCGGVAG